MGSPFPGSDSPRCIKRVFLSLVPLIFFCFASTISADSGDIVFVTQVPIPADFGNIMSTFGNHLGGLQEAPRGGDLYIRYSDGTLKNITAAAGYGTSGFQGNGAIAVRDPSVHWSGTKVLFSMVIGAPTERYRVESYYWQLYEVTGLGRTSTPVITKVSNQPSGYNNVMPIYGTDDRILFVTDRPRNGASHLYPQRDEYESYDTNSGLWSLDPATGDLDLLDHAPSGVFHPIIDSYGRVLFTRWDHLQRDQQNLEDNPYGAFNFSDESQTASPLPLRSEVFPESRDEFQRTDPTVNLHTFNHFFPWQINEDGTEHETLNHIGRHELHGYFDRSLNNDDDLLEHYGGESSHENENTIQNFFHIREDPIHLGVYIGIDAPEFRTHSAGQVISLTGAPGVSPDQMKITYLTHPDTSSTSDSPSGNHSGLYRNPLILSNGTLISSHTSETREDSNLGSRESPLSRYALRLKSLSKSGDYFTPSSLLTPGIQKSVSYYDPDVLVSYSGALWELQPVELISKEKPARRSPSLEAPEQSVFDEEGASVEELKEYLVSQNLALIVMRNITTRDRGDKQQPFNLRVFGSETKTVENSGKLYDVSHLQIFEGSLIRGYGGTAEPQEGRRVLAQFIKSTEAGNPPIQSAPTGSVAVASDGSVAAFVPARRALTWQLIGPDEKPVVRERYWLTFQPGEIRLCTSCHGLNTNDQAGHTTPANKPKALRELLSHWRNLPLPTDPTYTLLVYPTNRGQSVRKVRSGRGITVSVSGTSANAGEKELDLALSVGNTSCTQSTQSFTTNSDGGYALSGTVPRVRGSYSLSMYLRYQGERVAEHSVTVVGASRKTRSKRNRSREIRRICAALSNLQRPQNLN